MTEERRVAMILAGGIGLGAYQAGAYAQLHQREELRPTWLAGSSIGSINAAVIAGSPPERRVQHLRSLWQAGSQLFGAAGDPTWSRSFEHAQNWISAIQTRLMGSAGQFHPRISPPWESFSSLYDLRPLRSRLKALIDFGRLNSGAPRVTVATTNIESGELVLFDTAMGDRIEIDHLMASCGFLPEFAPVEIDGQLLGDGGLVANAPVEALWQAEAGEDLICFVLDLYARDGVRPTDLESALARKNDLLFSNQTWQRLAAFQREEGLRRQLARSQNQRQREIMMLYLSYRPLPEEAGPERGFDYSTRMLERRWQAGELDMREALRHLDEGHRVLETGPILKAVRRSAQTRSPTLIPITSSVKSAAKDRGKSRRAAL